MNKITKLVIETGGNSNRIPNFSFGYTDISYEKVTDTFYFVDKDSFAMNSSSDWEYVGTIDDYNAERQRLFDIYNEKPRDCDFTFWLHNLKEEDLLEKICIDVRGFSDEKKKRVQDAFFALGFKWYKKHCRYRALDAIGYTNTYDDGNATSDALLHTTGNTLTSQYDDALTYPELMRKAGLDESDPDAVEGEPTKNGDMPAMPCEVGALYDAMNKENMGWEKSALGLTKREKFCLEMGVPETGDSELDAIIRKGNSNKAAMAAMQGFAASGMFVTPKHAVHESVRWVDALLSELEK